MVASVANALSGRHDELLLIAFRVGRTNPNYHSAFAYFAAEVLLGVVLEICRVLESLRPFDP